MSFYIIIRGPLGCGKSTIAERVAKHLGAKYFSIDRILDEYNLTKHKEAGYISQKSFLRANEIIVPEAKRFFQKGVPVVFDGNFYWKSQLDDLVKKLNFTHHIFTLKAPLDLCIKRDKQREKTHGEDSVQAVYKKSTEFDCGTVIDINRPLDKCITDILSHLNKDPLKAIVFDADGVINNEGELFSVRFSRDYEIPLENITPFFKTKFNDCLIGKSDLKKELANWIRKWNWQRSIDELLAYWFSTNQTDEGLIKTIKQLRSSGIKCYLATNNEIYRTDYLSIKMGLSSVFDKIFSSAEFGCKKPEKGFFEKLFRQMGNGTNKNQILFVDNEEENVQAAKEFGFQPFLYTTLEEFNLKAKELL